MTSKNPKNRQQTISYSDFLNANYDESDSNDSSAYETESDNSSESSFGTVYTEDSKGSLRALTPEEDKRLNVIINNNNYI